MQHPRRLADHKYNKDVEHMQMNRSAWRAFFRSPWVYPLFFVLTLATTTLAGAEWRYNVSLLWSVRRMEWQHVVGGLQFSLPFLLILTCHEFGHYWMARIHKVKVSLPLYIPLWLGFLGIQSIGTAGAFIRIRERIERRAQYFDIGIAGPIAGFVVALFVLSYGFTHLPEPSYIFQVHPEYEAYGLDYAQHVYAEKGMYIRFGDSLLFHFFSTYVASPAAHMPHPYEMIHYPWLFAGYLALFFTALNLLPIGQLDGGHVLYGLFGQRVHGLLSRLFMLILLFYAGLGLIRPGDGLLQTFLSAPFYLLFLYLCLYSFTKKKADRLFWAFMIFFGQYTWIWFFPHAEGYAGWLLFAFLLGRVLGIAHPSVEPTTSLSPLRKVLGWVAFLIFVLCFSPRPFVIA